MAATVGYKTGVADSAAGAGVHEYLGFREDMDGLVQAVVQIPVGDAWQIKASASLTPTLITDTFPPAAVMAWKVPTDTALLFTGGVVHTLAACIEYYRVVRRYFLWGYQATAPVSAGAPTTALAAMTAGIGTSGVYSYKVAAIDAFRQEGPVSAAAANVTLTGTNQGVTVTPPALANGAVIGYNIYRTLAGGATWYYVGTATGVVPYIDAAPDSQLDTSQVPSFTWAAGAVLGETSEGSCDAIIEIGGIVLTGPPTSLIYTGTYGGTNQMQAVTITNTVGARTRFKPYGEASTLIPVPTATVNLLRGVHTSDTRTRRQQDYGVTAIKGVNAVPTAGVMAVWGEQVIGVGGRTADPVLGTIHAYPIVCIQPGGFLLPPLSEIVVEIGALAAGVAGVRDITLSGLLIPTTTT